LEGLKTPIDALQSASWLSQKSVFNALVKARKHDYLALWTLLVLYHWLTQRGIEVPYEEISTDSQNRRISIDFEEADSDIEIIGTFVVPEFGSIAMLVLIISIISIIILSNKFRINSLKTLNY